MKRITYRYDTNYPTACDNATYNQIRFDLFDGNA